MLGECQSKCEHLAGVPLDPEVAKKLHNLYLAKGVRGTTAIEGNTLSEEEVQQALDKKLVLPPSREYLNQEVQNIHVGLNTVLGRIMSRIPVDLNVRTVEELNRIILANLELEDGVVPGKIRKNVVGVMRYRGAPAEDCGYLVDRLGEWLRVPDFECPPEMSMAVAILKAIVAHLYLAWIHPFGDGNGRTARLVEFDILFTSGVPTPAAHLLSNHYNLTRSAYYKHLDQSSASGGDILPFVMYAVRGFLDGLKEQIGLIRREQLNIMWKNHVYEAFGDTKSPSQLRRRNLVLDLSKTDAPVRFKELQQISQRIALAYQGKTKMMLIRDLNALKKMNLILRKRTGTIANKELVEAFLPLRASMDHLAIRREGEHADLLSATT
jgi:Fic family protein